MNEHIAIRISVRSTFCLFIADARVGVILPKFCEGDISSVRTDTLESKHISLYMTAK